MALNLWSFKLSNFRGMTLSKVGGWVFFLTSYDVIWTQNQYVSDTLAHISFAQKKRFIIFIVSDFLQPWLSV